jgi:hypothetical protein
MFVVRSSAFLAIIALQFIAITITEWAKASHFSARSDLIVAEIEKLVCDNSYLYRAKCETRIVKMVRCIAEIATRNSEQDTKCRNPRSLRACCRTVVPPVGTLRRLQDAMSEASSRANMLEFFTQWLSSVKTCSVLASVSWLDNGQSIAAKMLPILKSARASQRNRYQKPETSLCIAQTAIQPKP